MTAAKHVEREKMVTITDILEFMPQEYPCGWLPERIAMVLVEAGPISGAQCSIAERKIKRPISLKPTHDSRFER